MEDDKSYAEQGPPRNWGVDRPMAEGPVSGQRLLRYRVAGL